MWPISAAPRDDWSPARVDMTAGIKPERPTHDEPHPAD
jgi:hypothetical protein